MESSKKIIKNVGNIVVFFILIYLIVIGQKNIGLVRTIANFLGITTNIGVVGICVMIIGLAGLIIQLYAYNKRCK